ncbi:MAG: NAD(P)/FAD-dependent oxidoreductase [Myxococcales bacterium]|nr:NAD(P)/FAD-dependent oxidoreductase [Myxococcales bacterium]
MDAMPGNDPDVIVVGGGVNGLVCALLLARSGLSVQVIEDKPAIGGMHRTEYPFAKAPRLATFTGAHRVGFVPRELVAHLALPLPLAPRDPSLFVPTTMPGRYLLAGAGHEGLLSAAGGVVSERDRDALSAMFAELDALASDLAPAWVAGPLAIEEVAERWVRPALQAPFVALCRGSFAEYAARFGIQSALLKAALAADSLGGSFASWDTPGSGAPLLVRHAACGLPGGGDAVVTGGIGALTRTLAEQAQLAGALLGTSAAVTQIVVEGNTATGVVLADGRTIRAGAVVTSADPWRLRALVGADRLPAEYSRRIDTFTRSGGIAKLNVAFAELPRFACLPEARGQHRATTFVLPGGEDDTVRALGRAFADASAGRLPSEPPLECVFPTAADESLRDPDGRHSASILVPWAPYDLSGTTWSTEEERFTNVVLDMLETFAPGARALVADAVLYHPKRLETHFGITRGHLGHVDDTLLFGDRLAPTTPISGLYTCGRGAGPAGGVFGVAGLNASRRVLADLELALEQTEIGTR